MIDPQPALQPDDRSLPPASPAWDWAAMPAEQLRLAARFGRLQRALSGEDLPLARRAHGPAGSLRHAAALLDLQRTAVRLEADLRAGLAHRAFHYEFQPMFRALTGEVYGYEALLRWTHGGRVVSPGRFVPLVEDAGLLAEIQSGLLDSVAALLAVPDFKGMVSLNWSPAQLARRSDVSAFAARVLALGLDPARIVIEISGPMALRDPQEACECLVFLKDLGFRVALDDFGRGHDGFSYLCNLPIDIVKVDGALVRGLSDSPRARMVLGAVVDVAHRLGHLVVAEGVETLDQLIGAARMGCGLVQGFLVGAPQPQPRQVQCGDPALFGIR